MNSNAWRTLVFVACAAVPLYSQNSQTGGPIISALRAGKYVEAEEMLETQLRASPRDPRLWTLQGLALVHLGKSAEALEAYQRALQISPSYLPALEGAAGIEYQNGRQAAVSLLEQIVKAHPEDKTSHAMLAVLAFQRNDCAVAAREFGLSEPMIDSQVSALQQYGLCLIQLKRLAEAIPIFERVSNLREDNEKARYNLAVVQSMAGRYADVIKTLSLEMNGSSTDPDALDLLAEAYEALSDTPRAVETLRTAIIENPENARYYVHFADISMVHASYKVGIDMVNAGLKRLPHSASLYVARGILEVQLAQYEESERDFSKAEQLDPMAQLGPEALGMAALQQNNLAEAEKTIRGRLRRNPNDAFLCYLLAETLARRGAAVGSPQFHEAVEMASEAVKLQPNFALGRDVLGRLYLEEGNINAAIEQSRLAVGADPADQTALYHLILAMRRAGNKDEVARLIGQLTQLREQARKKEENERKYALVERSATSN